MTYQKAIEIIRKNSRKGDELEDTFRIICRNRGSNPIRDWAIYDLAKSKKISLKAAKRRYNRHFKRLEEIFVTH